MSRQLMNYFITTATYAFKAAGNVNAMVERIRGYWGGSLVASIYQSLANSIVDKLANGNQKIIEGIIDHIHDPYSKRVWRDALTTVNKQCSNSSSLNCQFWSSKHRWTRSTSNL